jgi:hypothetical protein
MVTQNVNYLTAIHYIDLPERERKIHRERFQKYNDDLYTLFGKEVSQETFHEGGQYMYTELGDALLEMDVMKPLIQEVDLIIMAHWSQEYDPDYAVCVPYFLDRHSINADTFDVCDFGTVAPFLAIKLMLQYQKNQVHKNGMVLCLEQSTVPRRKEDGDIIPQKNGALGLFISQQAFTNSWPILGAGILSDKETVEIAGKFDRFLKKFFLEHSLEFSTTKILLRKGTLIWKLLNYAIQRKKIDLNEEQMHFIDPTPGCLPAMKALGDVIGTSLDYVHILLIDEDVESLLVSYIVLGGCHVPCK